MVSKKTATSLPLLSLNPVADAQHAWVAMLLHAPDRIGPDALICLFGELGLGEALDGLPCIVAVPCTDADLATITGGLGQRPGPHLATGIDTDEQFQRARQAGFSWFAGSYPLYPSQAQRRSRNAGQQSLLLQLLTLITHDAESHEIERLVKKDAQLSYQLLRLVNSVAFSPSSQITSFGQAITVLGRRQLQRWLQLLLYARPDADASSPLLPRAALRAALMEALCASAAPTLRESAFMVGIFSLLDVMMDSSLAEIVAPLHLSDDVNAALLERSGPLGPLLRIVDAADKAEGDGLAAALTVVGIDSGTWVVSLIRACHWAIRVSREA